MIKKVIYSLTMMFGASMIIGCGNDTNEVNTDIIDTSPKPHMFTRAVVENQDIALNISNDENYYIFNINSKSDHSLIYIDIDQDNKSGYTAFGAYSVGAEYLIEDNRIYKYTGSGEYDWSWKMVGNTVENDIRAVSPDTFFAKVPLDAFGANINIFNARAMTLDATWTEAAVSNQTIFTKIGNDDFNFKFIGSSKYTIYEMGQDELNLYFSSKWDEFDDYKIKHHQYYIDIDNDHTSGYTPYTMENMGAEYLVENGALYKYTNNRLWEKIQDLSSTKEFTEIEGGGTYQQVTILQKEIFSQDTKLITIASSTYDKEWSYVSQTNLAIYSISKANSVFVYKYKGSKQCEADSGISLEEMARELDEVISMHTANDGLDRIQVCGADTGDLNIYEIGLGYYFKAKELGFLYFKR